MTVPHSKTSWKAVGDSARCERAGVCVPFGPCRAPRASNLAGRGGQRRRSVRNVTASSGKRDPDCDASAHIRTSEPFNRCVGFRIRTGSTTQLPNSSAWTSSLGHIHRPMPERECQRKLSARRMVGGPGHRIGLRMDHQRSRLCTIPGIAVARGCLTLNPQEPASSAARCPVRCLPIPCL